MALLLKNCAKKMSCNFSIEFSETADRMVEKAEKVIKGEGGKFSGDAAGGEFSLSTMIGSVKGEYAILNQTMTIRILDKPVIIPCGKIENVVKKYLGGQ
jgi:hypothetical protein